jgi:hypothetical protein
VQKNTAKFVKKNREKRKKDVDKKNWRKRQILLRKRSL